MAEDKMMRLSLVAKQINVGISTIVQYLSAKGHKVDNNPNTKLNFEQLKLLAKEYRNDSLLEGMQPFDAYLFSILYIAMYTEVADR